MRPPSPTWDAVYAHDRRKHRHRCCCCNRIINAGDHVVMAKVKYRKTVAVHADPCAGKIIFIEHNLTWRELLVLKGTEYLRACGYKLPVAA